MSAPIPGARRISPRDEISRLLKERADGPAKVLHIGDVVRVYDDKGQPFSGRVSAVEHHGVPFPGHSAFGVICTPLEGSDNG